MASLLDILLQNMSEKNATLLTHSINVAKLCAIIARNLRMDDNFFYSAGLLHDVGKLLIPNALLDKSTPIGQEEQEILQKHSQWGAILLKSLGLEQFSGIALLHHQDTPGLPVEIQIVSVADKFEAMTSLWRMYRRAVPPHEAIEIIKKMNLFEPKVINALEISYRELNVEQIKKV